MLADEQRVRLPLPSAAAGVGVVLLAAARRRPARPAEALRRPVPQGEPQLLRVEDAARPGALAGRRGRPGRLARPRAPVVPDALVDEPAARHRDAAAGPGLRRYADLPGVPIARRPGCRTPARHAGGRAAEPRARPWSPSRTSRSAAPARGATRCSRSTAATGGASPASASSRATPRRRWRGGSGWWRRRPRRPASRCSGRTRARRSPPSRSARRRRLPGRRRARCRCTPAPRRAGAVAFTDAAATAGTWCYGLRFTAEQPGGRPLTALVQVSRT